MTGDRAQRPEPKAAPDVHRAIAKALQSAAALVGDDEIERFFRGQVGEVVAKFFPIDAGGIINGRCQDAFGDRINSLLNEK